MADVCPHLAAAPTDVAYHRWYTGVGLEAKWLCVSCSARSRAGQPVELVSVSDEQRAWIQEEADLDGGYGAPEVKARPEPFEVDLRETPLPWPADEVLDLASVGGGWLIARTDGALFRLTGEAVEPVCVVERPPAEPPREPWAGHALTARLHASRDGAFAAIVHDFGHVGRVYDLSSGASVAELDGGDYHAETVPFSFAFVEHQGRTVALHRTGWNRLEALDLHTGDALMSGGRPQLDYFHGRLLVSPDGARVLDDGWVWHPHGVPSVWDVDLEAEPQLRRLAWRAHYWNRSLCWLDAERVAISGIGEDEDWMVDGARVFDAADGSELTAFAGPAGRFFGDGERLFAAAPAGLEVWDVRDGARVHRIDGFAPTHQHVPERELVAVTDHRLIRWRY
ncbi:hypothetical protein DVA67_016840 [Solirubrobacter sp. CPCC 204708]|uniref:Uncharacterized protein n=1 Tax=Solirubrobacter deserti TaxID=2282478 RepID=A0ABT4RJ88_9ACTN|nr:hypothetical protein [Solirubrobacter deserti]MBE2317651.1 hypothetical protein [Solirubrobacter deserti]MDA0138601.1 hypothetical protein [Solirubrobacter deserti]